MKNSNDVISNNSQKKTFEFPEFEVLHFSNEDIICMSVDKADTYFEDSVINVYHKGNVNN